uniref:Uncharacterized protein n=1 Tax=Pyrodinium bahamense TaxID=73915 RepID=A0A7S0FDM9_9DINO
MQVPESELEQQEPLTTTGAASSWDGFSARRKVLVFAAAFLAVVVVAAMTSSELVASKRLGVTLGDGTAPFLGLSTSPGHTFKHMSKECVKDLIALEKEGQKKGKQTSAYHHNLKCDDGQQVCKLAIKFDDGYEHKASKCFPSTCKVDNIKKEVEADMPDGMSVSYFKCDNA